MHTFPKKLLLSQRYSSTARNKTKITNYWRITSFIALLIHLIDSIQKNAKKAALDVDLTGYKECMESASSPNVETILRPNKIAEDVIASLNIFIRLANR